MAKWLLFSTLPLGSLLLAFVIRLFLVVISCRRNRKKAMGFFHPYTNDGGGGERVLWCAVKAIQEESPDLDCVIYTGDHDASPKSLSARALDRFGVKLLHSPKVHFISYPYTCLGTRYAMESYPNLCKFCFSSPLNNT